MSKIPAINEIDANSPSQESTEVVVNATTVTPDINEIQETVSASATIQEIDGTRKPTISEIYKIVNDGLFESTTNWWDYAYKLSQAQINQDIISRLDNGVIGGGYSKGADIITTTSSKVPSNTNVYSALKSDELYPKKLNDELINGIYDFLNGITIGKPTAYTGGTWSVDKVGKTHLTTDYLYVRLKAIFETLQILNVDTIGGKLVISPAGSIRVAYVDRIKIDAPVFKHDEKTDVWSISQVEDAEGNLVNETLNQEVYRCYFLGEQDGEAVENKWKVGDQAQAKTFNVKKGTYHKVENSYLWRLVLNVSTDTVNIDGKKYHYVDLSQIDFDSGSDAPAPGDVLNQLGHRLNDTQRQTALVLNAVDNYAPSITLYAGINYYTLLNKEYVEFGVYNGKAFFNVYGDMYIGDKGTNPKTYIKYKNGKINIKANLEIGSSIGNKDLDQYIKENGGVDEDTVKNLINNAQVIKDLQKQTDGAIETWFYEGVPTPNNYPSTDKENKGDVLTYNIPGIDWYNEDINNYNAIKDSDKYTEAEKEAIKVKARERHIGDLYYDQKTGYAYRFTRYDDDIKPYRWNVISDSELTKILEAANKAQATADGKMKVFYGETKPTNYQVGDMWVNATLEGKFNNDIARAVAKSESFNADDWVLASRYSEAIATIQKWTNEYETKFGILADEVKQQKDQSIIVWYLEYEPTIDNAPANKWNTETLRSEHIGDIVYDIKNNHSYRWTGSAWVQIKDADFNEAMKAAKDADAKAGAAGDLADSKRRIFYSDTTPTKPFDKGDLWIKQVKDKTETWVYNGTTWVKSEDKDLADFSGAINKELTGIKGQLDGKAETWYQNTNPRNEETGEWESGGTDKSHKGDIWYDTTNGTTKYWTGSTWEKMDIPRDVFDTIDGKSSIFVDSYDDAKAGRGAINKGYKERDLWILPADAVVNGTAYYKGDILTATSPNKKFDERNWERKVRYIGPTELNSAIDVVNKKINTINNTTIPGINNKFNEFVKDGVLDSSEKARLTDLLNQASNEVAAVVDQVNSITTSKYLTNDNANKGKLEEANTVMNTAWTEYKNLINTLVDADTEITKVNIGEANTKYKNLQEKIKAVKQYLAICQADVLSGMGTDISSYKYLKDALNQTTEINGGLVLTSAIQLKDVDKKVTAGMNGIVKGDKTSIAAWYGGPMVDRDTFTSEELKTKVPGTDYAMSLLRHDGTGYLAGGNIHWNADGVLSGNFNSFILQGTSMVTMFYYIRLFYLHYANQNATDFNNIDYVTPMKTFSRLSVLSLGGIEDGNNLPTGLFIGDSKTGGSFQIGNIILRTKSGDPNILEIVSADSKKTAHLGVQGGVSAYGTYTPSTGGGGGLNASVKSYSDIIAGRYTDSDLTTIPNAYSIKALYNAIQNIDVTGQLGNYLLKTDAADTYQPKGNYLTTHQTIYGLTIQKNGANLGTYNPKSKAATINVTVPTKISELSNDSGYTNNIGTVTSIGLTLPTGLTCSTKSITTSGTFAVSFASGYSIPTTTKQTSWDSAVSVKHSHSNKSVLDGISSAKVTHWDSAYNWYSLMTTDEETADGIINKWNEVVNFLANIAQTDTLSGIINGINTSISNEVSRAKKAEGTNASNISANKTNITTLQGYFTNGSAKKALQLTTARKLWGNDFNGTTDINGSIVLPNGKYISIGNIKLEYDATNKALKITNTTTDEVANLYASGGVSAYGIGTIAGSGGLQGSIISYNNAISSDPGDESSKIASASSIYKLHSRIASIENNGATSITVTGTGNAITSVVKNGTSITFTKGATFLTSHQSLANCVQTVTTTGSGNAVTAISKSGSTISVTKGATFLTSHQSLANYYTKSSVDSLLSGKSATSHTHSVKINGVTKTIAATGGAAVDLGTYLTSHQSLSNYYTKGQVDNIASSKLNYRLFHERVNIDLNNITEAWKTYEVNDGLGTANTPTDAQWHQAVQWGTRDSAYAVQLCTAYTSNYSLYLRHKIARNWYPWIQLAAITDIPSSLKSPYSLSWSGYNSGSYDGSSAKSFVIPSNTNQLTNGAGFITSSASISGNAATATNADKLDGYHANGLLTALSNSDKGISITVGGTTKSVSNISVNYASSAGNADTVDGYHETAFPRLVGIKSNNWNWDNVIRAGYYKIQSGGITNHPSGIYPFGMAEVITTENHNDGENRELQIYYPHSQTNNIAIWLRMHNSSNQGNGWGDWVGVPNTNGNIASATKLAAARTIWGQSFDGTGNVNGTIYINNSNSSNGAIRLNNDISANARISAIDDQVIFNTGNAIRFGETAWDWSQWAGLKYTHSNKTIYLGIADGSVFNANSAQSNGTLRLAGITTITPDIGARIGNTGGDLYLGNSNNSAWVKVQNMCSQADTNNWRIYQNGTALFKDLTINSSSTFNGATTINNNLSVSGLITNKGILPTNYEVNNKGTSCYVSADALCSGITAITDSIQVNQVTIQYSNDNGNSWTNYPMGDDMKFNMYANNAGLNQIYLGYNVITGNNDTEKLAQVKKNELMVTFEISNKCYSQVYFASVDISNGIDTICTVEILNNSGAVVETYTKHMDGWNQVNYISLLPNGNAGYGVGNNNRRYIRFKFKHYQKTTALRNTIIHKIRIFSFTKYSFPTDRFMGHTGHIYNFDYNMNTYFPNSILAKGGVTAYQSSDVRLKTNIAKLNCLNVIKSIGGTYEFDYIRDHKHSIGFIAQNVNNPLLNDIVAKDDNGYLKINYWNPKLISLAFGALTEIDNEVDKLKARVRELETEVEYLKNKDYVLQ